MKRFFASSRRAKQRQPSAKSKFKIPQLPHDVLLYIVKHLQHDSKSLQACILASRAWREAAQPFLFRSIVVTGEVRLLQLEKYIQDAPTIASWIHRLEVDRSLRGQNVDNPSLEYPSWFFQLAPKVADKLQNLTALHFSHVTEAALKPSSEFFQGLSAFNQVRSLTLDDCHLTDPVLFAFISAFPNLETFHLRNHHRNASVGPNVPCLHPPSLTSLRVDIAINPFDTITPFLRWISTTPSITTLHSVTVRNVAGTLLMNSDGSVCVARDVGALLQKCTSLKDLGLTFVDKNEITRNDGDTGERSSSLRFYEILTRPR